MKTILLLLVLLAGSIIFAQPGKKPVQQKPPASQTDMNKLLEDAMKAEGMSKEEQEEMKKMMKDVMPALQEHNATLADYPEFASNQLLIPPKEPGRIAAIPKKNPGKADVAAYATGLFNKLLQKGNAAEIALAKKIIAQTPKANDIAAAAVLAMLQGHPHTALALSMKAVQSDPANLNWQNNMASLLTQYGYPEQALPLLRKLQHELPANSTVLNNAGQAWLSLGETDSAKRYFTAASRINPRHPEATLCGGLLEERNGDPQKAGKNYTESLENSPDPFTEQVVKNHNPQYNPGKLDFDKIKKSIAIYEYFPKDWITPPPAVSNDVKNHNEDYGLKQGYDAMINSFKEKTEVMADQLDDELQKTFDKGEDAFIKEMTSETIKGLSFMSKPAVIVLGVLNSFQLQWQQEHTEELKKMLAWKEQLKIAKEQEVSRIYKQISDSKGTRCEQFKTKLDNLENEYMRKVNTRFREYLLNKTEEFREWLNAYVTWNWYVAGNVKNSVLLQDVLFTAYLAELYGSVAENMENRPEHCNPRTYEVVKTFEEPVIPNFTCPAVVSIPAGPEWQELVAASKDFNKNSYGIKKTGKPVPNSSIGYGTAGMVAQPGIAPFIKTANGSIFPGGINNSDDELVPLPVIEKDQDLTPLPNLPADELVPLPDLRKSRLARELLQKMQTADCSNIKSVKQNLKEQLDRMMKKVRELEAFEQMMEEISRLENQIAQKEADANKREELRKKLESFQQASDQLDQYAEMKDFLKRAEQFGKEMDAMDEKKAFKQHTEKIIRLVEEMEAAPAILKEIQANGLQPSISSGVQAPGTFTVQKGLFN